MKRLLRSKVNFAVLEGFLSELIKDSIEILDVLESESNQDTREQHQTRVDLLVKTRDGALIIIEVVDIIIGAFASRFAGIIKYPIPLPMT